MMKKEKVTKMREASSTKLVIVLLFVVVLLLCCELIQLEQLRAMLEEKQIEIDRALISLRQIADALMFFRSNIPR